MIAVEFTEQEAKAVSRAIVIYHDDYDFADNVLRKAHQKVLAALAAALETGEQE